MPPSPATTTVTSGCNGGIRWELAERRPHSRLAPYVRKMAGYTETTPFVMERRELPGPMVVVIFEIGPPLKVFDVNSTTAGEGHEGGFVAGLTDGFTLCVHRGFQAGVQLNLTPIGARRLLGLPLSELTNRAVSVHDVLPRAHRNLSATLAALDDWEARFDVIEQFFLGRLRDHTPSIGGDVVEWAAQHIEAAGGAIDVGALTAELGYSHKHVIRLFREHAGVPPKLYARIVRFDRLISRMRAGDATPLSHLAIDLGYSDQSHLNREVRALSGLAPRELRLSDGYDPVERDVNSVQDAAASQ